MNINIHAIYEAAMEIAHDAKLSLDAKKLENTIHKVAQEMIDKKLDPSAIPGWEGPAGLSEHQSGHQSLVNVCAYAVATDPQLWALHILLEMQRTTKMYLHYDSQTKETKYTDPAPFTAQNIRRFLQARANYWYFQEKAAKKGLAIFGETKDSLKPTDRELQVTQDAIEEIADEMYLPGILQSQNNWSQNGAKTAHAHLSKNINYETGFVGHGLSDAAWNAIARDPWRILLDAAMYRPLFSTPRLAFDRAMRTKLSGYMIGQPSREYAMLKDEHYPKNLKEDYEPPKDDTFYRPPNRFAQSKIDSLHNLRRELEAASRQQTV